MPSGMLHFKKTLSKYDILLFIKILQVRYAQLLAIWCKAWYNVQVIATDMRGSGRLLAVCQGISVEYVRF